MQYLKMLVLRFAAYLPDKQYVYLYYWIRTGEVLRLKNPRRYSQKIQWLKLNGNLEQFAQFADKYTVRDYVERTIGTEYLIPLIGVWDTFDKIPYDELPQRFVLKVTNGCGYNYICKDKTTVDKLVLKSKIEAWQRENFFRIGREAQYKPNKSRIICEQYLEDSSGALCDYKIHCEKGVPQYVQVDVDRFTNHKSEILDLQWRKTSIKPSLDFDEIETTISRPGNIDKMIQLASLLAAPFPYVRVDLYSVGEKIYFGELTFTPGSGNVILRPEEGEIAFGDMIDLDAYTRPLNV